VRREKGMSCRVWWGTIARAPRLTPNLSPIPSPPLTHLLPVDGRRVRPLKVLAARRDREFGVVRLDAGGHGDRFLEALFGRHDVEEAGAQASSAVAAGEGRVALAGGGRPGRARGRGPPGSDAGRGRERRELGGRGGSGRQSGPRRRRWRRHTRRAMAGPGLLSSLPAPQRVPAPTDDGPGPSGSAGRSGAPAPRAAEPPPYGSAARRTFVPRCLDDFGDGGE